MTIRQKLEKLNGLVIDEAINQLENGEVGLRDLASIITLLRNNKVIEEKVELLESDLIDTLVENKK